MHQPFEGELLRAALPHDTGFLEITVRMGAAQCGVYLRLTTGSAREYLAEDAAIQKRWNPHDWLPLVLFIATGTIFLSGLLVGIVVGPEHARPLGAILGPSYFVIAGTALSAFVTTALISTMRSRRRALAQSALERKFGVSDRICTGIGVDYRVAARKVKVVARELRAVTPEVQSRLFGLIREGKAETAGRAVRLLADEAPQESGLSRREEREAVEADARCVISQ